MAFDTSQEQHDISLVEQRAALTAEITRLGQKIEEAQGVLDTYNLTTKEVEDAKSILAELNTSITEKTSELNKLETDITASKVRLQEHYDEETVQLNKLADLGNDIDAAMADVETIGAGKVKLEAEIAELNQATGDVQKQMMEVSGEVITKQNELDSLNAQIEEANKNLSEVIAKLEEIKLTVTNLIVQRGQLESDIDSLVQQKATNETLSKQALDGVTAANKSVDEHAAGVNETLLAREDAVAKREGEISDREAWLKNKEQQLIDLKKGLEDFYGRKFDNIKLN